MPSFLLLRAGVLAGLLAFVSASPAQATTVLPISLPELARDAELIFQGRVIASRVEEVDGLLYTWLRFEAEEILKGQPAGREFELRFLGGESQGRYLRVAELTLPLDGERGIYFVERLQPGLVNPLLGWWQGHYRLEQGANGEESLSNIRGEWPALADPAQRNQAQRSDRSALQLQTFEGPIDPEDFKATVQRLLEETPR